MGHVNFLIYSKSSFRATYLCINRVAVNEEVHCNAGYN